jgi:hypothetical protein
MKNFIAVLLFGLFGFAFGHGYSLPENFWDDVKILKFDDHGWMREYNKIKIKEFIGKQKIKTAVELGTWLGQSALFIATLLPSPGVLYCVDTWDGFSESIPGTQYPYPSLGLSNKVENQYEKFLSNVKQMHLTEKIIPVRMKTHEASKVLDIKADLIYIDASHDEKSVYQDIIDWSPKLNPNGIICGDDYDHASVKNAVQGASITLNKKVCYLGSFWWLE